MNNPEQRRERLLAETFHDDWATGSASEFAQRAAAQARRQRRRRKTLVAGATCAAVLAVVAVTSRPRPPVVASPPVASATVPAYEIISDAELLAELRDRAVLVVKRSNGTRDYVVVGQ